MSGNKDEDEEREKPVIIRNTTDYQRLKLEKLMKNPEKPVIIPEKPKERGIPHVPDFVRNVMGSSAGAGSGEFHVYRHLRRKEYARQKYMKEKAEREKLNDEYQQKLEANKRLAEERTAKKRAKRIKRKEKKKQKKPKVNKSSSEKSEESSDDGEELDDLNTTEQDTCDMIKKYEHDQERGSVNKEIGRDVIGEENIDLDHDESNTNEREMNKGLNTDEVKVKRCTVEDKLENDDNETNI